MFQVLADLVILSNGPTCLHQLQADWQEVRGGLGAVKRFVNFTPCCPRE